MSVFVVRPTLCLTNCHKHWICIYDSGVAVRNCVGRQITQNDNFYIMLLQVLYIPVGMKRHVFTHRDEQFEHNVKQMKRSHSNQFQIQSLPHFYSNNSITNEDDYPLFVIFKLNMPHSAGPCCFWHCLYKTRSGYGSSIVFTPRWCTVRPVQVCCGITTIEYCCNTKLHFLMSLICSLFCIHFSMQSQIQ